MAYLTTFYGSMWSGKTTRLCSFVDRSEKGVLVLSPIWDTRNERSIQHILFGHEKCSCAFLGGNLGFSNFCLKGISTIIIDEVHLFEVFCELEAFIRWIYSYLRWDIEIAVAGVHRNGNRRDLKPFNIWKYFSEIESEAVFCKSLYPCSFCGGSDAEYSIPKSNKDNPVGDHYENVCGKCALNRGYLREL